MVCHRGKLFATVGNNSPPFFRMIWPYVLDSMYNFPKTHEAKVLDPGRFFKEHMLVLDEQLVSQWTLMQSWQPIGLTRTCP